MVCICRKVFSAYNLYVDGVLVGQMGNPDPEHYVERTQNRMFTFKANISLEILIAVTDKSSASPGIQSVPVFGNPLKINTIRGISVFINSSVFTLIILVWRFPYGHFLKPEAGQMYFLQEYAFVCSDIPAIPFCIHIWH